MQTGIGNNPSMTTPNGNALVNFAGEIDEAACFSPGNGIGGFPYRPATFTGAEQGILGLWHLDGNGSDSATYTYAAPAAPAVVAGGSNVPTNPSPTANFPLQP